MSDSARTWHLAHSPGEAGPLAGAQLAEAVRSGRVPRTASAWREGLPGWIPVTDVPEVASALERTRGLDAMPRRQLLLLGGLSVLSGGLLFIANMLRALAGQEVGMLWSGLAGGIMAPGVLMLWKALRRR